MLHPAMLRYVAFKCCCRLAGSWEGGVQCHIDCWNFRQTNLCLFAFKKIALGISVPRLSNWKLIVFFRCLLDLIFHIYSYSGCLDLRSSALSCIQLTRPLRLSAVFQENVHFDVILGRTLKLKITILTCFSFSHACPSSHKFTAFNS